MCFTSLCTSCREGAIGTTYQFRILTHSQTNVVTWPWVTFSSFLRNLQNTLFCYRELDDNSWTYIFSNILVVFHIVSAMAIEKLLCIYTRAVSDVVGNKLFQ